jgi:hypothetical protein
LEFAQNQEKVALEWLSRKNSSIGRFARGAKMNLLLNRDQKSAALFTLIPLRIGSGVMFQLHAELELDEEEESLVKKYKFEKSLLVASDPIEDLKMSFRPAALLGIIAFIVFWIIGSFSTAFTLGLLVTLVMTGVYFRTLREQIIVSDLLNGGRTFRCDSIIELIDKEAYLEHISEYLRQVIESAKNWHDREAITIKPLNKADAKKAVLAKLHAW